jgi:hypothetical protein
MIKAITKCKNLDWFNSIMMIILYSEYSVNLLKKKPPTILYNTIFNKFKFTINEYKSILQFLNFDTKVITYMMKYGYPYNLFIPVFMNKLELTSISFDYYNHNIYYALFTNSDFIYKKSYLKFNEEVDKFAKYCEIAEKLEYKTPDYIFVNICDNSQDINNDYSRTIELLINTIPQLETIFNIKNYKLQKTNFNNFDNEILYNNEIYHLDSCIFERDDMIIAGLTNNNKHYIYKNNTDNSTQITQFEWYKTVGIKTLVYCKKLSKEIIHSKSNYETDYNILMNKINDISSNKIKQYIANLKIELDNIPEKSNIIKYHIKILKTIIKSKPKTKTNIKTKIETKPKTKLEYIELIKKQYPYYIYLNKYTIAQLKQIHNKLCNNIYISYDGNNSCYMDSLFVALFNTNNEFIKTILLQSPANVYSKYPKLSIIAEEIRMALLQLYDTISSQQHNSKITECKSIRLLFQQYHNKYKKYINPKYNKIEWTKTQNDYMDILTFLVIIFKIPNTIKYKINNRIEYRYFVDSFSIDNLTKNDILYIKDYYPKYKNIIELDSGYYDDETGELMKYYTETIEFLAAPFLFMQFNRNMMNDKINTKIIPVLKLKLKENSVGLYLNSIIIHSGSAYGGHYTCLYECKGIWYEYNDLSSNVIIIGSFENIIKNDDYTRNISALIYL